MFLPVRHHSPACARMVRDTILRLKPAAVLIEGPVDFNERMEEIFLPHQLPIAIYSYVAWADGRRGAYHPLCEYSPEWQALQAGRACGAKISFIDLPFACMAREDRRTHRYADDRLRSSDYVRALCEKLGVESVDEVWDQILEVDPGLSAAEVLRRVSAFCNHLREADEEQNAVSAQDLRREAFMAAHVRAAFQAHGEQAVVVVTGGYHTRGLQARLREAGDEEDLEIDWPPDLTERGIALTPYSYERLDGLAGYDAGMPSPGFYHAAWRAQAGETVHGPLLKAVTLRLRELKQMASTADLISVEACAQGLAALRGHPRVWRRDLIDGITGALVKDEMHGTHPFMRALQEVLRGGERGKLAQGARLPPLVLDIQARLAAARLTPEKTAIKRKLSLMDAGDLEVSRLLHQLRVLGIPGFVRTQGVDFEERSDLTQLTEEWQVQWTPEQDAQLIEASRYGSALHEAVCARLVEGAREIERSAAKVAVLLLDAVLAGVMAMAETLRTQAMAVIHEDGNLGSVAIALGHLLYLFAWDDALGVRGSVQTGTLLAAAYARGLWLLESGGAGLTSQAEVEAVRLMRDAFERAEEPMQLSRPDFAAVLERVQADVQRSAGQRGACAGALWSLRCADPGNIRRDLRLFADPAQLGDFLVGIFALAREEAQADSALLAAIHGVVMEWDDEGFLTALPSLRLAFMYFTAREKVHIATRLFPSGEGPEPVPLAVSISEATQAMAFEQQLLQLAQHYGIPLDLEEPSA